MGAFSKLLRDSNHVLQLVNDPDFPETDITLRRQDGRLQNLQVVSNELKMNANDDKKIVAQQKVILLQHIIGIDYVWQSSIWYPTSLLGSIVFHLMGASSFHCLH